MKEKLTLCILFLTCSLHAQNKYGLVPMSLADYKSSYAVTPDKQLVNLAKEVPGVVLDIRYATTNNFTHGRIYRLPRAYVRKPVAAALRTAQAEFAKLGFAIKIYDAYRPYKATVAFYELYRDTTYVASPYRGSRHNRGCAIDMTLVDVKTGRELKMPTEFDSFEKEAWPTTPVSDPQIARNRDVLISVMERNGFKVYASEWWHFDFIGWMNYEVMDVDFEELDKL